MSARRSCAVPESHLITGMRDADRYVRSLPSVVAGRAGWRWQSPAGFFLGEGQPWFDLVPFAEVDEQNPEGAFSELNQCFWNAQELVLSDPERFTYCEGYALRATGTGAPVHHAWAVDEAGRVVDTTWARDASCAGDPFARVTPEEGRLYFGVQVPAEKGSLWLGNTGKATLMHGARWSTLMLLQWGFEEGFRRNAFLADHYDPEWVRMMQAVGVPDMTRPAAPAGVLIP
jgi:hypothetical protein